MHIGNDENRTANQIYLSYAIDERQDTNQDSKSLSVYVSDINLLAWQLGYKNT